jgi:ATP-dependent protease ClpP protease subunit
MPDLTRLHNLAGQLKDKTSGVRQSHARGPRWYDIKNAATGRALVYLYDFIGEDAWSGGGISARDFTDEIKAISAPTIELHINSEGGEVFDGIAIYESLKQHPARVEVIVDSLAASAASFIAMAGDKVTMARNARMMIHDAAMGGAYASGNAADMRDFAKQVLEMADLLDDMSLNIADIYAQRAGGHATEWRARMQATTWYSAVQARDVGLVDEVLGEDTTPPAGGQEPAQDVLDFEALRATLMEVFHA